MALASKVRSEVHEMAIHRDSLGSLKGYVQMATYVQTVDVRHLATADVREALICEVRRGLIVGPRWLSPWISTMQRARVFLSASRLFPSTTPHAQKEPSWRSTQMRSLLELTAGDRCRCASLSWVPAPHRRPAFCSKPLCASRATSFTCQSMSAPTPSSWRAKTWPVRCRKCA